MRRFVAFGPAFVVLIAGIVTLLVAPALMRQHAHATTSARITLARQTIADDDLLARMDAAVQAVADAAIPSVVHIETEDRRSGRSVPRASGAGWVYDARGHVITNYHVVRNATRISAEFHDGMVRRATLVGADPYTDIAVLALEGGGPFYPARLAEGALPVQGQRAFAFGSPFGFKFSMSEGIVSGLGREPPGSGGFGGFTNYIQTDAAVNPGNSGGPLVDASARVIGMNVAIATARNQGSSLDDATSGDSAGISFAIPMGTIRPIVSQILEHGEVQRGFLGISFGNPDDRSDTAVRRFFDDDGRLLSGIQVFEVTEGGPSARAGLESGDVIVNIGGYDVLGVSALRTLVSSTRPGVPLSVQVWREGELREFTVTLDPMPEETRVDVFSQRLQVELGVVIESTRVGPMVRYVLPGPAYEAGLEIGQIIQRVNGEPMEDARDVYAALMNAGLLTGGSATVEVRLDPADDAEVKTVTLDLGR